jgi:hypothetical protein
VSIVEASWYGGFDQNVLMGRLGTRRDLRGGRHEGGRIMPYYGLWWLLHVESCRLQGEREEVR